MYILDLTGYEPQKAQAILQNLWFWCLSITQRGDSQVYDISTSYTLTAEFLESKGIPADAITPV